MARSSGFKINRHLHNFLRVLGVVPNDLGLPEAQIIAEIRNICGKYQPNSNIEADLQEIQAMEASNQETENGNSEEDSGQ